MHTQYGFPRQRSIDQGHFAIAPQPGVSRSAFTLNTGHKTTFDAGHLVPVYYTEVLPGDSYRVEMTALTRMATPVFPVMDNLYLDSFFFFVPYRLCWSNWRKFMGERTPNTNSSIDYVIPKSSPPGPSGYATASLQDYFGLPVGVVGADVLLHSALPLRAYLLIWNEWFRDENLQDTVDVPLGDGPDPASAYVLQRRGKRYDYFTSALPSPQKGNPVTLPLGTTAPVLGIGTKNTTTQAGSTAYRSTAGAATTAGGAYTTLLSNMATPVVATPAIDGVGYVMDVDAVTGNPRIYADLSQAAAATVNTLRTSVALQQFLERDARGGTRYTEIIRSHFGVMSPDSRLQRPEYLGGGSSPITINPVAQTSATDTTVSGASPLGNLAGVGMGVAQHGFSQSFTEHGIVIGLVSVRADLNYQQGLDRFWSRDTRHDFFWPEYAHLGEQAVLRKEIYATGTFSSDDVVFGYQERYAEYRFHRNLITGMFRSGVTGSLDQWHLAQYFGSAPVLGPTFIQDSPPVARVVSAGALANKQQFLFDSVFSVRAVRPIPMYGTPGLLRL